MPGATARFTTRADGDLAASSPASWTTLRQVHGNRVVVVTRPGEHRGEAADAAVTDVAGAVLCIRVADCAPVAHSV